MSTAQSPPGVDFHETFHSPWSPHTPVAPRPLDDAALLSYRHRFERPSLVLGCVLSTIVLVGLMLIHQVVALIVLGLLALWASACFFQELEELRYYGNSAEVTPTQFPHLYPIVAELRQRWSLPRTHVVVIFQPGLGARASGFREPYLIKIDSWSANFLEPDELRFLIGKEMAHIKFGHPRIWTLAGGEGPDLPALLGFINLPQRMLFSGWRRVQTYSADRGGVLACGKVSSAVSALLKVRIGPWAYPQLQFDVLGEQADHLHHGWRRLLTPLAQILEIEPVLLNRMRAMVEWAGPPEPGSSLALHDPAAFDPGRATPPAAHAPGRVD